MVGSTEENLQCHILSQISNVKSYHKGLAGQGGFSAWRVGFPTWVKSMLGNPRGYPSIDFHAGVPWGEKVKGGFPAIPHRSGCFVGTMKSKLSLCSALCKTKNNLSKNQFHEQC